MSGEPVCSRCGTRLIAGLCPACPSSGVTTEAPQQRKTVPRGGVGAAAGIAVLLMTLTSIALTLLSPHAVYRSRAAQRRWPKHEGPVAQLSELHGHGTIYLLQLTPHKAAYSVEDLAQWLHTRYGLDARTLPPEPLPQSAWDGRRRQYVAELLYAEIKKDHPTLAASRDAYLIGVTDAGMYPVGYRWASTFTQRDEERAAIVSSASLEDSKDLWSRPAQGRAAEEHLQARLRRVLLKDVAMLYWHLPVNNDPSSLLHQPEDPDLPTEDIYASDLDPAGTRWGQFEGEPCLFFRYSAKTGLRIVPGRPIRSCSDTGMLQKDDSELFEVDLRLGTMVDRRTELSIPGAMPIAFERALRPGWTGDHPFGVSGTDSYDTYLSSRDNIYISAVTDDGGGAQLVRDPIWLSYLPLTKYVDTQFSGSYYEMHWRTSPYPHYDLRRFDGRVESYLPCYTSKQYCYLNGVAEADGRALQFRRDVGRHLLQVTSSDGSWLKLQYSPRSQIEQIEDSRGQTVRYGYNERNQLTSVTYPSGETLSFAYDKANELTAFSASPDGKTAPQLLLQSEYKKGLLQRQVLADGSTYVYSYGPLNDRQTHLAVIDMPDGMAYTIQRYGDISGVWETGASTKGVRAGSRSTSP